MPGTFPSQPLFNTLIVASGAPANTTGNDGDAYIDNSAEVFYGPRSGGVWPAGSSIVGPTGAAGSAGSAGSTGATGSSGTNGNTIISGTTTPPPSATGNNGDYYYNTSTYVLWGPKASGAWPASGTSLVGPQGTAGTAGTAGSTGAAGTNGTNGTNGNTILNGSGAPASGTGNNGDFYIDTAAFKIYGPKASGAWPATGTSIVGPAGSSGSGSSALPTPIILTTTAPTLSSTNNGASVIATGSSQLTVNLPATDTTVYAYTFVHVSGAGGLKVVPGDSSGSIVTAGGTSTGSSTGYVSEASIGTFFTLVRAASSSTWYMTQYFTPVSNAITVGA